MQANYVAPHRADEDDDYCDWEFPSYETGFYSGFTPYTPSREERAALKKRQPIGFIHFPDYD